VSSKRTCHCVVGSVQRLHPPKLQVPTSSRIPTSSLLARATLVKLAESRSISRGGAEKNSRFGIGTKMPRPPPPRGQSQGSLLPGSPSGSPGLGSPLHRPQEALSSRPDSDGAASSIQPRGRARGWPGGGLNGEPLSPTLRAFFPWCEEPGLSTGDPEVEGARNPQSELSSRARHSPPDKHSAAAHIHLQ